MSYLTKDLIDCICVYARMRALTVVLGLQCVLAIKVCYNGWQLFSHHGHNFKGVGTFLHSVKMTTGIETLVKLLRSPLYPLGAIYDNQCKNNLTDKRIKEITIAISQSDEKFLDIFSILVSPECLSSFTILSPATIDLIPHGYIFKYLPVHDSIPPDVGRGRMRADLSLFAPAAAFLKNHLIQNCNWFFTNISFQDYFYQAPRIALRPPNDWTIFHHSCYSPFVHKFHSDYLIMTVFHNLHEEIVLDQVTPEQIDQPQSGALFRWAIHMSLILEIHQKYQPN